MRASSVLPLSWWLSLLLPGFCLQRQVPVPGQGAAPLPQQAAGGGGGGGGVSGQYGPPPGASPQPPFQQGVSGQYGPPPGASPQPPFQQGVPGQYGPVPGFGQGGQWGYPQPPSMVQGPYGQVAYGMPSYMPPPYAQSPYGQGAFAPAPYAPPPPAVAGAWPPAGAAAPPASRPRGTLPPPPTMDGMEYDGRGSKFLKRARDRIAKGVSDTQQSLHASTGTMKMANTLSSLITGKSAGARMKQSIGGTLGKLGGAAAVGALLDGVGPHEGISPRRIASQALAAASILSR